MESKIRDVIYGVAGTVLGAALLWVGSVSVQIRDSVRSLEQYHASEWPLERQLLSIEIAQLRARVDVLEDEVSDLEASQ